MTHDALKTERKHGDDVTANEHLLTALLYELEQAGGETADVKARLVSNLEHAIAKMEALLIRLGGDSLKDNEAGWRDLRRLDFLREQVALNEEQLERQQQELELCRIATQETSSEISAVNDIIAALEKEIVAICDAVSGGRVDTLWQEEQVALDALYAQRAESERKRAAQKDELNNECERLIADEPLLSEALEIFAVPIANGDPTWIPAASPDAQIVQLEQSIEMLATRQQRLSRLGSNLTETTVEREAQARLLEWTLGERDGRRLWVEMLAVLESADRDTALAQSLKDQESQHAFDDFGGLEMNEESWLAGEIEGRQSYLAVVHSQLQKTHDRIAERTLELARERIAVESEDEKQAKASVYPQLGSFVDGLLWALREQWSGRIDVLVDQAKVGEVRFQTGTVVWASCQAQQAGLGVYLRKIGGLSKEQLAHVRDVFAKYGGRKRLGTILEEEGLMEVTLLRRCLLLHTRSAIEGLLRYPNAVGFRAPASLKSRDAIAFFPEEVLPMSLAHSLM